MDYNTNVKLFQLIKLGLKSQPVLMHAETWGSEAVMESSTQPSSTSTGGWLRVLVLQARVRVHSTF